MAEAGAFRYRAGILHGEGVSLPAIAEAVGTPFYCYSATTLVERYRAFAGAFAGLRATVCYAVKANSNQAVLRLLAREGAGADVVSEGELRRALAAGIEPRRIVFSGVGKTEAELAFAVATGAGQINLESEDELDLLSRVADAAGLTVPVVVRANPDVDALTHAKISTGKKENKFGVTMAQAAGMLRRAATLPGVRPAGLAVHIGSQLTNLAPYRAAFARICDLFATLRAEGLPLGNLDLGGGLGIDYRGERPPPIEDYAAMVRELVRDLDVDLTFEPGRWIAGPAGALVSRVIRVKEGLERRFVVQDAAMNDLIRPSLYDAYHRILPVVAPARDAALAPADIVGPVCETGDLFAVARPLPPLRPGDLLAVLEAGAYGAVMSCSYNSRLLIPEVMVQGEAFAVVRPRPSYEALIDLDRLPPWLEPSASGPAPARPGRMPSGKELQEPAQAVAGVLV